LAQKPVLILRIGDIVAKFGYEAKKLIRNVLMEMGAQSRKLLIQKKFNRLTPEFLFLF